MPHRNQSIVQNGLTSEDLLAAIARGSRAEFSQLYDRMSGLVFSILHGMLRDRAEAEELLQEVFIRIWTKAHQFDGSVAKADNWVAKIARHAAIDQIRSRARRPQTDELSDTAESPAPTPELQVLAKSDAAVMSKCLAELEDQKAQAVQFAYCYGFSYEELATHFSVPLNTLKSWLRRGLQRLRDCIMANQGGADV